MNGGGSFWTAFGVRFGNSASGIDDLLEKENLTLEELLDHEDVIQDCKFMNANLIEYLSQPEVTLQLIRHVVTASPKAWNEKTAPTKYPYIASELFMCEMQSLLDTVFEQKKILHTFFGFLDRKAPLDPGSAAYFRKVFDVCIDRKYEQVLEYASQSNIISKLVSHIGLESMKELLIKLGWGEASNANFTEISLWLYNEALIPKLVSRLDPTFEHEPDVHANAALTIVDLLLKLEENPQNVLLTHLKSTPILNKLFRYMLSGSSSCLQHILGIFIILTRQHVSFLTQQPPDEEDVDWGPNVVIAGLQGILPQLVGLLDNPPDVHDLTLQHGKLPNGTLGPIRLHLMELFDLLLRVNNTEINEALVKLDFFTIITNLFFQFENNNMLHGRVDVIVRFVIDSKNPLLQEALFGTAQLTGRLIETTKANQKWIQEHRNQRLGYMGHIYRISNVLVMAVSDQELLKKLVCTDEWTAFVEGPLAEENKQQSQVLGGARPMPDVVSNPYGFGQQSGLAGEENSDEEEEEEFDPSSTQAFQNSYNNDTPSDWRGFSATEAFENNSSSSDDEYPPHYSPSSSSSDDDVRPNDGVVDLHSSDSESSSSEEEEEKFISTDTIQLDSEPAQLSGPSGVQDPFDDAFSGAFDQGFDNQAVDSQGFDNQGFDDPFADAGNPDAFASVSSDLPPAQDAFAVPDDFIANFSDSDDD